MRRQGILLAILTTLSVSALTIDDIKQNLAKRPYQTAKVRFEVLMPSAADPVVYDIELQEVNPGDTLAPSFYLIDWSLNRNDKISSGFNSYYEGDHFRYRDTRLQEYHYVEDPMPFSTEGGGVQRNAQFADLLPAFIAEKLEEIVNDTTYHSNFDEKSVTISGIRNINGYDALEYSYKFDENTGLPVQLDFLYNPASISEQSVTAYYTWENIGDTVRPVFNEAFLIDRYGDVFEKFRTSNFRVENLRGSALPTFSFEAPGKDRRTHSRGEADLGSPVLLVFLDAGVASTQEVMDVIRASVADSPFAVTTIYAFADNEKPADLSFTAGEYTANSPQRLIRKCGVTSYPTFVLVKSDGTIADVIVGNNADLTTNLTQSLMLVE